MSTLVLHGLPQQENSSGTSGQEIPPLPAFTPVASPVFVWGERDAAATISAVTSAYQEVVHWRKNSFQIPVGNTGSAFVSELSRLYRAYAEGSALECIALKAATIAPIILLQRSHRKAKPKDNIRCLEHRLALWKVGDFDSLLDEGRALQQRLPNGRITHNSA